MSGSSPGTARGATASHGGLGASGPAGGAALPPGTWLGKHQLLHRLAIGGMAEIYLARATGIEQFEKLLVLKRMLPQYADDHRFIRMFLDEARLAATFSHPNIAHVYDIGGDRGAYYFTMEYIHGADLVSLLRAAAGPVPLAHALTIAAGVAAGLHAAHDKRGPDGALLGVVHRDVSPSNILVGYDGSVKLVDFGIARIASQHGVTRPGGFLGKARYASPEQVQGGSLDRRSDVFALGIVLFELTTGARPFDSDSDVAVLQAIAYGAAPRPSARSAGYPAALEAIVLRALQRDPGARFATAQELQLALEDFARGAGLALSSVALASYAGELFGDRIAAWHEARRAGRSLTDHVIASATGRTVDLAALDASPPPMLPPPVRPRGRKIAAGLIGLAAMAGVAFAVASASRPGPVPPVHAAVPAPHATPRGGSAVAGEAANPASVATPSAPPAPPITALGGPSSAARPAIAPAASPAPAAVPTTPSAYAVAPPALGSSLKAAPGAKRASPRAEHAAGSAVRPTRGHGAAAVAPSHQRAWDPDSALEP